MQAAAPTTEALTPGSLADCRLCSQTLAAPGPACKPQTDYPDLRGLAARVSAIIIPKGGEGGSEERAPMG
jgi:hypothetical protein